MVPGVSSQIETRDPGGGTAIFRSNLYQGKPIKLEKLNVINMLGMLIKIGVSLLRVEKYNRNELNICQASLNVNVLSLEYIAVFKVRLG